MRISETLSEPRADLVKTAEQFLAPGFPGHYDNVQKQTYDVAGASSLIDEGQAFHGLRFDGRRFDCGDKLGFLEATVALGLQHPELGPGLRKILSAYL